MVVGGHSRGKEGERVALSDDFADRLKEGEGQSRLQSKCGKYFVDEENV